MTTFAVYQNACNLNNVSVPAIERRAAWVKLVNVCLAEINKIRDDIARYNSMTTFERGQLNVLTGWRESATAQIGLCNLEISGRKPA